MAELKKNSGLNIKPNPIQPRNTTLGAINNVLSPNQKKINLVDEAFRENKDERVNKVVINKQSKASWWKK